jgi:hypothetical protein
MKPFFTYDFYNFSHISAVSRGQNPVFKDRKRWEVENTTDLNTYMKKAILSIDFLDESVDLRKDGAQDYIGSARVPLQQVLNKEKLELTTTIIDDNQHEVGKVTLFLSIHDSVDLGNKTLFTDGADMLAHRKIQTRVIDMISRAFAAT